jgi:regulator of sigma E protease
MLTVAAGILMLGILVFVHEFGHFCVAKLAGVKVLKFSLGFGPKLVSRKWGETEYMICAIPLGGYVQMLGEGEGEEGEAAELTPQEKERSFAEKPVSRRTAIVAAGPLMNLLLPFLILPVAYLVGVHIPAFLQRPACVGYVAPGSQGEKAGFVLRFSVARDGRTLALTMKPKGGGLQGLQSLGLLPPQAAVVGALAPRMPAEAAGMKVGDRILSIGGTPIHSWYDLKRVIQKTKGAARVFSVDRDGRRLALTIKPVREESNGPDFLIGIAPQQETTFRRYGPLEAIRQGARRTTDLISLTLVFIKKLVTGHVSTRSIGGPITVVQIAGQAAQTNLSSILSVLAFLSIQLGLLNLFPIPILDGGHLLFNLFELVFRRPLSLRTREIAQQIGLVLIIMLMVLAFYNDIVRIFFGGS